MKYWLVFRVVQVVSEESLAQLDEFYQLIAPTRDEGKDRCVPSLLMYYIVYNIMCTHGQSFSLEYFVFISRREIPNGQIFSGSIKYRFYVNISQFQSMFCCVSKTIQDRSIVTISCQQEIIIFLYCYRE